MTTELNEKRAKLQAANVAYYDNDEPIMSDAEYDALRAEVETSDPNAPELDYLGSSCKGQKVKHKILMGSLEKITDPKKLVDWHLGKACGRGLLMPKLDGISLSLHYRNGKLKQALTRGDGEQGENVTAAAMNIPSIPQEIEDMGIQEVRGEAVIPDKAFYGIQDVGPDAAKNPRNSCAGAIRNSDPQAVVDCGVEFIACSIAQAANPCPTFMITLARLAGLFKYTVPATVYVNAHATDAGLAEVKEKFQQRMEADFGSRIMCDGLVLRIDDEHQWEILGYKGKCPLGSVAFKFPAEEKKTGFLGYQFECSRQGRIVPVFKFVPVQLAGTEVSQATGNNIQWIETLGATPGDALVVRKANEIIPQVVRLDGTARDISHLLPKTCPSCAALLSRKGVDLVCTNTNNCRAHLVGRWLNALVKIGIKGVAEATLSRLLEHTDNPLAVSHAELTARLGFSHQQATNICDALNSVTKVRPEKLLAALGIRLWGRTLFADLPVEILQKIVKRELTLLDIEKIMDKDGERAMSLLEGLRDRDAMLVQLLKHINIEWPQQGCLTGKSFCCTGTLSRKRNAIEDDIVKNGGQIKSSVGKGLDYLVVGTDAGSKLEKAQKLGIKIIDEATLNTMLGGGL